MMVSKMFVPAVAIWVLCTMASVMAGLPALPGLPPLPEVDLTDERALTGAHNHRRGLLHDRRQTGQFEDAKEFTEEECKTVWCHHYCGCLDSKFTCWCRDHFFCVPYHLMGNGDDDCQNGEDE